MREIEDMNVQIDGLALKQELTEADNWLPNVTGETHYPPYEHQVEMRDLIENKDQFVAMNTTITGGGKTFSYAVPTMREDMFTIVVFPTNALTADQFKSISDLGEDYFPDKNVMVKQLTADSMQEYREKQRKEGNLSQRNLNNGEQIRQALINAKRNDGPSFILTNPDIFIQILRGNYHQSVRQHMELADMVVVDEFHHARPKGKNSLVISMDELYNRDDERCNLKRFVFLSATPDEKLEKQLKNKFGPPNESIYHRIDSTENSKPVTQVTYNSNEPYNPVMPIVNTKFISGRPFSTKKKILSADYFNSVLGFIESGRSIIILDGVAEVNDVYHALRDKLPNLRVEPISGMRSKNTSDKLEHADVIVANSTLEVGVDIGNVEQLIYTGFNASSFMQRLGRLRAEKGKIEKDAICFTTPEMIHSFKAFEELTMPAVPRDLLHKAVNRKLDNAADTELYRTEFTPIEMYYAIDKRAESMFDSETNYRRNLARIVSKHCFELSKYKQRKSDIEKLWKKSQTPIGEAMQSYRQSSLTAIVYDDREDCQTVKTYPISSLLRFADIEFLTEPMFDHRLESRDIDTSLYDSEKQYVQAYAWMNGYKSGENLRNPHIAPTDQIQHMLGNDPKKRYPTIMNNIEFTVEDTDELQGLGTLNKQLSKNLRSDTGTNIIGYATEGHPAQIQTVYSLDEFFFTNPITDLNGQYTLALGENALYLHCHVQENIGAAEKLYSEFNNQLM